MREQSLKDKVEADINEMKLMISAALDFLRDQAGPRSRQRLDLRLLVESVVDDQSDVGHDATLANGESLLLEGDPLSLRRLVVNLVDNALKCGQRARLRLRKEGDSCTIEIDDDGRESRKRSSSAFSSRFFAVRRHEIERREASGLASRRCVRSHSTTADILSCEIARREA